MRILIRLLGFLKPYWKRMVVTNVCLLLATAFSLGVPELIKWAIDIGVTQEVETSLVTNVRTFLILVGVAILGAAALRGLFAFGQTYLAEYISQRVAYDIRNRFYDRIQRLSFAFHDKAQTGQLMSRATQDVEAVRFFISIGGLRTVQIVLIFGGVCGILFVLNWRLALISVACMPFVGYWAARIGIKLRPIWTDLQEGVAQLGILLQENLSGVKVVRAFAREDHESAKFHRRATKYYEDGLKSSKIQAANMPFMSFIFVAAIGLIIYFGGRETIAGRLTVGEMTQFYAYLLMLMLPIRMLGYMVAMVSRAISAGERIFEVLDTESEVVEEPGAPDLGDVDGLVRFDAVSFNYQSADPYQTMGPVLNNVSFEVQPGQMVALLGATGSGKTTLVNLIPRFYDATAGAITIDGVDVRDVTLTSLRGNIGLVQQEVFLFSATISDNIAYGASDAGSDAVIAAAKTAQLHDFIETLPDGYDTWVGERGLNLSGGQKQRLAIARTLLTNPRILIFDDSTSSVDTETEYLIQQALRELIKGRTTFVIAQRLQTVRDADVILVLDKGTIAERGTHEELLKSGPIYSEIYDLQLRDQEESLGREVGPR